MTKTGKNTARARILLAGAAAAIMATGLLTVGPAAASAAQRADAPAAAAQATSRRAPAAGMSAPAPATPRAAAQAGRRGAVMPQLTTDTNAPCNAPVKKGFARCLSVVRTPADHQITPDALAPPSLALGPADLQSAYKLPPGGQGRTVAIVDAYGDSHAAADLAAFRSYYNLPACTTASGCFQQVNQAGGTTLPHNSPGWGLETSLDLDAVSSACPACRILLVEANNNSLTNMGKAVDEAVALGAKYVSNSYGVAGELSGEQSYDKYYNHPGVVVAAASGDNGYGLQDWPASNPNVVAVGGTTLVHDPSVPRGWTESAWSGSGSGCSPYEPQPAYQNGISTGCANRALTDISADADPWSGLAVYDTLGRSGGGWVQVGGTSMSTPLITAMYALAGAPLPGTYPVTYPYSDPRKSADLFDITQGSNDHGGTCTVTVLCNAGPGWDGPTGWGTPDGVRALAAPGGGDITGTVTSAGAGKPVDGATITAPGGYAATTSAQGTYDLYLPPGSYTLTGQAFGYQAATQSGVTVTAGQVTTQSLSLAAAPEATLSGTVRDGSGHGWPLYAKITISGDPKVIYTSPYTGRYTVKLPQQASYQLQVSAMYPGYKTTDLTVQVGTASTRQDIKIRADKSPGQAVGPVSSPNEYNPVTSGCTAPGYAWSYTGVATQFTGWSGTTPQQGWTVADNQGSGQTWNFSNPGHRYPPPGGDSGFAIVDSTYDGPGNTQNTALISPVVNLSGITKPEIGFDTANTVIRGSDQEVDLSLDGGQTWTPVWQNRYFGGGSGQVVIPVPQAVGQANVQVRFVYSGSDAGWWSVGNVFIGTRACQPAAGGLVDGVVTDARTGKAVNGAMVTGAASPAESALSATTGDPALPSGFYSLFSPAGTQQFTATSNGYAQSTGTLNVAASGVTRQDWALNAGHLTVSAGTVSASAVLGQSATADVTLSNDGTAPMHITLTPAGSSFTPTGAGAAVKAAGAPLRRIHGHFTPAIRVGTLTSPRPARMARAAATAPGSAWANITSFPSAIYDNAVAYDPRTGDVYSVGGAVGGAGNGRAFVYDPSTQAWRLIANPPQPLSSPVAAFSDGRLYVAGGRNAAGGTSSVYSYDPSSGTWSQATSLPEVLGAGAAAAVLGGQVYVVGGCSDVVCTPVFESVYRYDPVSNTWTRLADYPVPVTYGACAGIAGEIVCSGGLATSASSTSYKSTYVYNPAANTWTQAADMPYDDWGMAYAGANDELQIIGGVMMTNSTEITNQVLQYDPVTNTWSALPNANTPEFLGGGGCGLYQVGGVSGDSSLEFSENFAESLPGYGQCLGASRVPWLSENTTGLDLAPGQSATVTVSMDSSKVSQPGTYTADLAVSTDTPYLVKPLGISLTVKPPDTWGELTGTVTDAKTGKPIAGATVQITALGGSGQASYTTMTDASGHYQWWADTADNPLQVIAAKDGYAQQVKQVKIKARRATALNFALQQYTASTRAHARRT